MKSASYSLLLSRAAAKYLESIRPPLRDWIDQALADIAEDPRGAGCRPLRGDMSGTWRRRVGAWRILYEIVDETERRLLVSLIDHRKQVYR